MDCQGMERKQLLFEEGKEERKYLFADRVVAFSSQYGREGGDAYTAINIAKGKSVIFPRYGDFKEAFVLRTYGTWWQMADSNIKAAKKIVRGFISKDFVEFLIPQKLFVEEIEIFETYNPGAVVSIFGFDYTKDKWVQLWSVFDDGQLKNNDEAINRPLPPKHSRKFCPLLRQIEIFTDIFRLEFADFVHDYYIEIDGVAVRGPSSASGFSRQIENRRNEIRERELCSVPRSISTEEKEKSIFDLPSEIINMIVSYLDLVSHFQLRSTCKFFHKICSEEAWFNEFNLQPYWMMVNDDLLESILGVCKRTQIMNLSWTKTLSSHPLKNLFNTVSETLTVLSLSSCLFINDDMLEFICKSCINLNELDLQSCENISEFHPISNLSDLRKLNLYRTSIVADDAQLVIDSCSNLKHLNLGSTTKINDIQSVLKQLETSNLNLKGLELWRCNVLGSGLLSVAKVCTDLEELDLGWCSKLNTSFCDLQQLIVSCKKLKKLFLVAIRISDNELECISQNLPDLELLDILGSSSISREKLDEVFVKCKKLKFFDISFCTKVTNVNNAVSELRTAHPHCQIKASYQE